MDIRKEDFPENFSDIVEIIGVENSIELIKMMGGQQVYIPSYKTVIRGPRDRKIACEFSGCNYKELSRKYRLTTAKMITP